MSPPSPRSISFPERFAPAPVKPLFLPPPGLFPDSERLVLLKEGDFFEPAVVLDDFPSDFFLVKDGTLRPVLAPGFPDFFSADFPGSFEEPLVLEGNLSLGSEGVFFSSSSAELSSGISFLPVSRLSSSAAGGASPEAASAFRQIFRRRTSSGTLWMRCSGFFRRSSWMARPNSSLISAHFSAGSGISSFRWALRISFGESPLNGSSPVAIWKSVQPRE